jgi:hypothetical protein
MENTMTDVWTLESNDQESASDDLNIICSQAINGDINLRSYLRSLWDNQSWESIERKLNTEGSVWYVWWMDGVNQHLQNIND